MKNVKTLLLVFCIATFSLNTFAQPAPGSAVTYQEFYDALSPYGNWIDYPQYGHVWHPNVADFKPYYTNGYWESTDGGWYWFSDYDWGWAPFHYGRWFYDDTAGWLWEPGYDWSPAWVTWGEADDYYAWAPLAPWVETTGAYGSWTPNSFYWNMVPKEHINDHNIAHYGLPADRLRTEAGKVSVINNFGKTDSGHSYVSRGPETSEVQRVTGKNISPRVLNDQPAPVKNSIQGDRLNIYRPSVQVTHPAVTKKINPDDVKTVLDRSEWPSSDHTTQVRNIQSMPEKQSPAMHGNVHPAAGMQVGGSHRQ